MGKKKIFLSITPDASMQLMKTKKSPRLRLVWTHSKTLEENVTLKVT